MKYLSPLILLLFSSYSTQAQEVAASGYRSQVDEDLTIRRVILLPFTDNVGNIFANPLNSELNKVARDTHHYNYVEFTPQAAEAYTLTDLEQNPEMVKTLVQGSGSDAVLAGTLSNGPNGITMRLDLFLVNDGKLLLQESVRNWRVSDINTVKAKLRAMHDTILTNLPYDGMVLSRTENTVTLNLGVRDGVKRDQIINAVLILQATRHPHLNFLVSSEKEILGKIRLTKVDDTLSFGTLVYEKEKDTIRKFTKIAGLDEIVYAQDSRFPASTDSPQAEAQEWVPAHPATFGRIGMQLGFGTFAHKTAIDDVGGLEGRSEFYPRLQLEGELWLTPRLLVRGQFQQAIASFKNPRESSTPANLTTVVSTYNLSLGYNLLMTGDFSGPKVTALLGFYQYKSVIDNTQPTAFTSMTYSGPVLGVEGVLPLDVQNIWAMGVGINFMISPKLEETPESSADTSKNTINQFYLMGRKKLSEKLHATGTLTFESHSTAFSGSGSRAESVSTDSQTSTVLAGGVQYLF